MQQATKAIATARLSCVEGFSSRPSLYSWKIQGLMRAPRPVITAKQLCSFIRLLTCSNGAEMSFVTIKLQRVVEVMLLLQTWVGLQDNHMMTALAQLIQLSCQQQRQLALLTCLHFCREIIAYCPRLSHLPCVIGSGA